MSFRRNWLDQVATKLFGSTVRPRRGNHRHVRVEALEERKYLSATMSLANQGHTLIIAGDRSDNHIAITQDERGVHVTADGAATQDFTGIDLIQVSVGDGDDDIRVIYGFNPQPDPPASPFHVAALQVSLGGGNDSFNSSGQLPPGPCRMVFDAGPGNDDIRVIYGFNPQPEPPGDTLKPSLDLTVSLGDGDDSFTGDIMLPPGPCRVGVDGGVGNDVVNFRTVIDPNVRSVVDPNVRTAALYANLGAGNDVFNGDFVFPPDPCRVMVNGGDGADVVSVHAGGGVSHGSGGGGGAGFGLDLYADLGNGNDLFRGDVQFPPDPCRFVINAGAGDDAVTMNAMLDHNAGGFNFTTNLGLGNDRFDGNIYAALNAYVPPDPYFPPGPCRVSVMGDGGADSINALIGLLTNATPAGHSQLPIELMLNGGDGNDFVQSVARNVNLNFRTNIDLQGGLGNDVVMQKFDNVTINGGLNLNADGGAGDDYVILSAATDSRSTTSFVPSFFVNSQVRINVQGGLGNDRLIGGIIPCVRPQDGTLDMVFSGGAGNDLFNLLIGLEPVALNPPSEHNPPGFQDGPISLTVIGGEGDDQLNLTVQNLGNSTSPLNIRLDGAPGQDTAVVTSGIDTSGWTN